MTLPETPQSQPSEGNDNSAEIMQEVKNQLQALQQSIEQSQAAESTEQLEKDVIENAVDTMADVVAKALDAGVTEDQLDAVIADIDLQDEKLEASLESNLQQLVDARGELEALQRDIDPAVEKKEETSMVAMVATGMNTGLEYAKGYVNNMEDGRVKTVLLRVIDSLAGGIVSAIESLAKSPLAGFLLNDADIVDIGNMRFAIQEKTLEAFTETKATYQADKAKYKERWLADYMTWFKAGQKGDMPALLSVVKGESGDVATPVKDQLEVKPNVAAVFSGESTDRTIGSNENVKLAASDSESILVESGELKIAINGKTTAVELQKDGKSVQVDRITRIGAEAIDVGAFVLHGSANSGEFTVAKLLDAAKKLNDSTTESTIESTSISVKKAA